MTWPEVPDECWIHEALEVRPSPIEGRGLFARRGIGLDEVVVRFGGRLVSREELLAMFESAGPDEYIDCLSFVDGVDLVLSPGQDVHYANHSCDPNLWHADAFTLVARRPISADEEVVVDYATHSDDPNFSFICLCGSSQCRGVT